MSDNARTCLVTGGAGFIGSHPTERLAELGHHVRVVDDLSTGRRGNLAHLDGRIEFVMGDLATPLSAAASWRAWTSCST